MAEGARLESVYRGNSIQGSNPCLSAILFIINKIQNASRPQLAQFPAKLKIIRRNGNGERSLIRASAGLFAPLL